MEYNNYYAPAQPGLPGPPQSHPMPMNQQHGCSPMQMMHGPPAQPPPHHGMRQVVTPGAPTNQMQQQPGSVMQQALPPPPPHHQQSPNYMNSGPPPPVLTPSGPGPQPSPIHHGGPHYSTPPPPPPVMTPSASAQPSPMPHSSPHYSTPPPPQPHQQHPGQQMHQGPPPNQPLHQGQPPPPNHQPTHHSPMPQMHPHPHAHPHQQHPHGHPHQHQQHPHVMPHQHQHPQAQPQAHPHQHPHQQHQHPHQHNPHQLHQQHPHQHPNAQHPQHPQHAPQHHQHPLQPPPPSYMPPHVGAPIPTHHPHSHLLPPPGQPPASMERGSPFYQNIPQTEFRIIELNKRLQSRPRPRGPPSPLPLMESSKESYWWGKFACDFFDDDSTLTLRVATEDKPIEYTIGRTLIPRFFKTYFDGGAIDLSIKLRNTREMAHSPHLILLECDQTDIITKNVYKNMHDASLNVVVHTEGHLSLEFVSNNFDNLLIKSWRFYTNSCHEYVDRSITTNFSNGLHIEPVTRFGLTTATIAYLKMCKIMEPMQDLMFLHRRTNMIPRNCLKHLLYEKYKHKSVEDTRPQPTKRRKRKTPTTTGATGTTTNKRNKANANQINANNLNFNNVPNSLMSSPAQEPGPGGPSVQIPEVMPDLSLASQDVMVVGEPSMLGADFNDKNERCITRLENNQFDASVNVANHNNMPNNGTNINMSNGTTTSAQTPNTPSPIQ